MRTLAEALDLIAAGWNIASEISDRAVVARSHARNGHAERAEEIAAEIDALQRATFYHENPQGTWDGDRADGIVWRMSTEAWADMAVHAYRLTRYLVTPFGTTQAEAEAHARTCRRPRLPFTLKRVDQFEREAA